MTRRHPLQALAPLLLVLASTGVARGDTAIVDPWIAEPPPGSDAAAGYATVVSRDGDRLLSASCGFALATALHGTTVEDGVAGMRPVEDGLEVPPDRPLVLEPGGFHIMFAGLEERLRDGDRLTVTLVFEDAGAVDVLFPVIRRQAAGGP